MTSSNEDDALDWSAYEAEDAPIASLCTYHLLHQHLNTMPASRAIGYPWLYLANLQCARDISCPDNQRISSWRCWTPYPLPETPTLVRERRHECGVMPTCFTIRANFDAGNGAEPREGDATNSYCAEWRCAGRGINPAHRAQWAVTPSLALVEPFIGLVGQLDAREPFGALLAVAARHQRPKGKSVAVGQRLAIHFPGEQRARLQEINQRQAGGVAIHAVEDEMSCGRQRSARCREQCLQRDAAPLCRADEVTADLVGDALQRDDARLAFERAQLL